VTEVKGSDYKIVAEDLVIKNTFVGINDKRNINSTISTKGPPLASPQYPIVSISPGGRLVPNQQHPSDLPKAQSQNLGLFPASAFEWSSNLRKKKETLRLSNNR